MSGGQGSPVVVVGASVAGLATALFLARQGQPVVLVDQDPSVGTPGFGANGEVRRTTPQSAHSHIFLARLRTLLAQRAPDVLQALLTAGAHEIDLSAARGVPGDGDLVALASRRSVLESVVRAAVVAEPLVTMRAGTAVRGLVVDLEAETPAVRGVMIDEDALPAVVVVDASGRRTPAIGWLGEAGIDVDVEVVDCGISYVSRFYRLTPDAVTPPLNRGFTSGASFDRYSCLVFPGDERTFSITFGILPEDRALRHLTDGVAFDAAVGAIDDLAWWVDPANATPISEPRSMTGLKNRQRRYVRDGRPLVHGICAVGDACSTTNPAHSRGTTLAFVHAAAIADAVVAHGDDPHRLAIAVDRSVTEHLAPWFRDSIEQDAARLSRWRPDQPAVPVSPGRLGNGELYTVGQVDPDVWVRFAQLQNLMTTPDDVLGDAALVAAVRERLASMAAAGVRPPASVAPTHDQLAELVAGATARRGRVVRSGAAVRTS